MKSTPYQYSDYSPTEFEQFRAAVQADGFTITQNTIDTVSGHLGSLTYLTGSYNRNQRLLTVTIKSSPWQNFTDADVKSQLDRIVQRDKTAEIAVNQKGVHTPTSPSGSGATLPPKAAVTPAVPPAPIKTAASSGDTTPDKVVEAPVKVVPPAPAQTPKPAQTPAPAQTSAPAVSTPAGEAATTATPTESK